MRIAMECRPDFLLLGVSNLTPAPDLAAAAAGAADAEGASLHARLHPSLHFIVRWLPAGWGVGRLPSSQPRSGGRMLSRLPCACPEREPRCGCWVQADLEWTDEQRDRLRPCWQLYNARTAAIRSQAQQNLDAARMDAVAALAAWESLLPHHPKGRTTSVEAYTRLVDSTSGVDAWLRLELVSMMELAVDFLGVGPCWLRRELAADKLLSKD